MPPCCSMNCCLEHLVFDPLDYIIDTLIESNDATFFKIIEKKTVTYCVKCLSEVHKYFKTKSKVSFQ